MPPENILTRDELYAFTEAHKEQALALAKVCDNLTTISTKLDKLVEKLDNGIKKEIMESIVGVGDEHTTLNLIKKDTADNKRNIEYAKWFVGIIALVIIIVNVVVRGIDTRMIVNKQEASTVATMQKLLEDHLKQFGTVQRLLEEHIKATK
jgi:hypothetical protein